MENTASTSQNVQVALRIRNTPTPKYRVMSPTRPGTSKSPTITSTENPDILDISDTDPNSLIIIDPTNRKPPRQYTYDSILTSPTHSQAHLYDTQVRPIISKCMAGFNGCIFAYGMSGSGKTYTMEGPANMGINNPERGVMMRAAEQIVAIVQSLKSKPGLNTEISVTGTYLEIYQEHLRDLLEPRSDTELKIRFDPISANGKDLFVEGLSERPLVVESDYLKLITDGTRRRTVGETNINQVSSRSHAVLTIIINQYQKIKSGGSEIGGMKRSKLHLIDLAGSERTDATGASGTRLKEGASINQSLLSLGNVINALSANSTYIPYRDSKLTYLLSDSLGGNSLTLVLACITPLSSAYEETGSTLRFAERAKHVQNRARINIDPSLLRFIFSDSGFFLWKLRLTRCDFN